MGEGNWAWRTGQSWVVGASGQKRGWSETLYEGHGDPVESKVYLEGALTREEMMRTAGIDSVPMPPSNGTWITTSKTRYDGFGNSIFTCRGGSMR